MLTLLSLSCQFVCCGHGAGLTDCPVSCYDELALLQPSADCAFFFVGDLLFIKFCLTVVIQGVFCRVGLETFFYMRAKFVFVDYGVKRSSVYLYVSFRSTGNSVLIPGTRSSV
jgi:hypothetical protein